MPLSGLAACEKGTGMIHPDSLLQGIGCLLMMAAALGALSFLEVKDWPDFKIVFYFVSCITPCCGCCGLVMVWHGCGGGFGTLASTLRCDGAARQALEERADYHAV